LTEHDAALTHTTLQQQQQQQHHHHHRLCDVSFEVDMPAHSTLLSTGPVAEPCQCSPGSKVAAYMQLGGSALVVASTTRQHPVGWWRACCCIDGMPTPSCLHSNLAAGTSRHLTIATSAHHCCSWHTSA
jgi:hypothetical protein